MQSKDSSLSKEPLSWMKMTIFHSIWFSQMVQKLEPDVIWFQ